MQSILRKKTHYVTAQPLAGIDKALVYKVTGDLFGSLQIGSLVSVPLRGRRELAIIIALEAPGDYPPEKGKFILGLEQDMPVLSEDLVRLAQWMSAYYAVSIHASLELMIPGAIRKGMRVKEQLCLFLKRQLGVDELQLIQRRAPKQAELYAYVISHKGPKALLKAQILKQLKISDATCKGLVQKGVIEERPIRQEREAYADSISSADQVEREEVALMDEQAEAVESISRSLNASKFKAHLLHGVTGAGKTEVYLRLIRSVIEKGGGAIFLVPEVALTPQTVSRLRSGLEKVGAKTVVWHSHLSDGERYDAWHAVASGEAKVVVGARSALFSPVKNLQLIIVDEEHEPAYKQDETPRYHGRDVAVYRSFLCKAVCVLGSATPSLESLYNVEKGKYQLNRILKRVDDRQLPLMHVVDMRMESRSSKGPVVFSRMLIDKLQDRIEKKEQSILFINRRGYNSSMMCPDCGFVAGCNSCDITLTFHRTDQTLRCHMCGHEEVAPHVCPKCKSAKIRWKGSGTQRIEDIAQKFLPNARIVRIDADTMQKKDSFREILGDFRRGKIDVLVGTQMIAKGLDFPNVTLVSLIDSDISMHLPDFRAAERTFQLLVQVAGRAGRGDRAGEVVIQTHMPHAAPIQFARSQDFTGFADEEIEMRREYAYPPFRNLVHHMFRGKNPEKVSFYADQWVKKVEETFGDQVELRGPAEAPIAKIKDNYRFQVWYFVDSINAFIPKLQELRRGFPMDKEVIDVIDVDAVSLI